MIRSTLYTYFTFTSVIQPLLSFFGMINYLHPLTPSSSLIRQVCLKFLFVIVLFVFLSQSKRKRYTCKPLECGWLNLTLGCLPQTLMSVGRFPGHRVGAKNIVFVSFSIFCHSSSSLFLCIMYLRDVWVRVRVRVRVHGSPFIGVVLFVSAASSEKLPLHTHKLSSRNLSSHSLIHFHNLQSLHSSPSSTEILPKTCSSKTGAGRSLFLNWKSTLPASI